MTDNRTRPILVPDAALRTGALIRFVAGLLREAREDDYPASDLIEIATWLATEREKFVALASSKSPAPSPAEPLPSCADGLHAHWHRP